MPIVPMATSARAAFAISALLTGLSYTFQNVSPDQDTIRNCFIQNYGPLLLNDIDVKLSFFYKLKKGQTTTKQDILIMEMDKQIFKKHQLNELAKINSLKCEEIMQMWQTELNVSRRTKRSAKEFQNYFNRIKNIIPGYLRGKVKPVVDKKNGNSPDTRYHARKTQ